MSPYYTDEKSQFDRDGFLLLPNFYSSNEIDAVLEAISRCKKERPMNVVVDLLDTQERTSLGLLSPADVAQRRMKINDLYLDMDVIRQLALSERLAPILTKLLGLTPVLCNSLYLEKGSEQAAHVDALYMTPRSKENLIASWVALEDSHPDAGQLEYFPGSHRIPQMLFSNGTYHYVDSEMPSWTAYMDNQVQKGGFEKKQFKAKKGDVFIWHSNLLHGGGKINNAELTRKSLVFHYYSLEDVIALSCKIEAINGAYWMNRAPQQLPKHVAQMLPFSEEGYLARYPDVAAAVAQGTISSGKVHYEVHGIKEGRVPC